MTYSFHPDAEAEFFESIDYYEKHQADLGLDFSTEVYKAIQTILSDPTAWTKLSDTIQRRLLNRFPFGVLYHFDENESHVFIVAIMHLRKKPDYWTKRL